MLIGWHVPPYKSDDHYVLSLLDTILGDGQSCRLYRQLVASEKPTCVDAYAMHMQLEDQGIFGVGATVMQGKDPLVVRSLLEAAISNVIANGITEDELAKAKTIQRIGMIHSKETATSIASQVGEESVFGGDANRVNTALSKLMAVTTEDVRRVAEKYFLPPHRPTVLFIKPDPLGAQMMKNAATQVAAVKETPVNAATAPITPRVVEFPKDYPTTAPSAEPRPAPVFAKGVESDLSGLRTIVMTDSRLPLVNFSLTMRRGSQSDPPGKEGVNWLTSQMLHRGIKGMNFEQLSKDLDSRGINIDVGDGGDYTRLTGSCTTDQLEHAVERARQILREPTFPQEEFDKLKEQSINSLQQAEEEPSAVASNDLTRALWGESVLGRYATPKSVSSITLDDVKNFYARYYSPLQAILIFSGDVSEETGKKLASNFVVLGDSPSELPPVDYTVPATQPSREITVVDRGSGIGSVIRMGLRAYDIHTDEKFAGSVASQILTAGIDSRLGRYVRAEKGLVYSVHGVFEPGRKGGAFSAGADTKVETAGESVEAIFKVLSDMRNADVTPTELAEAKSRVAGSMVMGLQTIGQQARYRVEGILNDYPIDYYDKYPARIAAVTAEQVREVMNKYVDPQKFKIVIVAPANAVKPQLEKLGEVKVVPMPAEREGATTRPSQELLKKAA